MRTMETILADSRYAIERLLPIAWHEHDSVTAYQDEIDRLSRFTAEVDADPDHSYREDPLAMSHMGAYAMLGQAQGDLSGLQSRLAYRQFSTSLVAGAVLQIGKQALSMVHGHRVKAPAGRTIGSQHLRDIVWFARNQAIHWEERKENSEWRPCFEKLAEDFGPHFRGYFEGNLSFDVLALLGWRSSEGFARDMKLMA